MSREPVTSVAGSTSRREFIKGSGLALAGAALTAPLAASVYASEKNTIKVALVGCGGRGTGAAVNALSTEGPTQLYAMADVFQDRLDGSLKQLKGKFAKQVDVPAERAFVGFDGYKKAIDAIGPGGVVLLTTPPGFRPLHVEYAVEHGCHVFMEKSFGVDAPGARRIMRAGETATKKNLKIAGGVMCRHSDALAQTIGQIHDGLIGQVITCYAYRMHGPVGYHARRDGESELLHQIRNYSCFTWLNGTFLLDWLIHNLDVCCWVKDGWPVSAQAMGGRQMRTDADQLFDHYAVEYTFADDTRMIAQGRHIDHCFNFWGCVIHGAKGSAQLGEGIQRPRIYKSYRQATDNVLWQFSGHEKNPYQLEHDLLFAAIREDKPYNEAERCGKASMTGILGRMAVESGQQITWDQAMASNAQLAPGLDDMTFDSKPPVEPDKQGAYPVAKPGVTKVL